MWVLERHVCFTVSELGKGLTLDDRSKNVYGYKSIFFHNLIVENFLDFFSSSYQISAKIINNSCLTGEKYASYFYF